MFFYLCMESIKFAPLKSQGSDVRAQNIREEAEREPHAPPPCSPKAIHSLAVAVGFYPLHPRPLGSPPCLLIHIQLEINRLRDNALSDIQSKITSENAVNEFFSSSAPRWVFSSLIETTSLQRTGEATS